MDFLNHAHGTGQGIRRRATFAIETEPTALAIVKPAHFTIQALLTLLLRLVPALLAQHTRRLPFPKTIRPRTAVFARGLPLCFGKGRHGTHLARKRRFPWLTVPFRAEQAFHATVPPTVPPTTLPPTTVPSFFVVHVFTTWARHATRQRHRPKGERGTAGRAPPAKRGRGGAGDVLIPATAAQRALVLVVGRRGVGPPPHGAGRAQPRGHQPRHRRVKPTPATTATLWSCQPY